MSQIKISSFIVGLLVASMTLIIFSLFISNLASHYNIDYDNTSLQSYDKINNLTSIAEQSDAKATGTKESSIWDDILGGFFSDAYQTIEYGYTSIQIYKDIVSDGVSHFNIGASGKVIRVTLSAIVVILLIFGVLLSAIAKRDL